MKKASQQAFCALGHKSAIVGFFRYVSEGSTEVRAKRLCVCERFLSVGQKSAVVEVIERFFALYGVFRVGSEKRFC